MRHLIIAAALALAACGPTDPPASIPAAPLARTVVDEQAYLLLSQGYELALLTTEAFVDVGILKGERADAVKRYLVMASTARNAAREARATGNAATFAEALTHGRAALEQAKALLASRS